MIRILIFGILLLCIFGCESDRPANTQLDELPLHTPGELIQFDSSGDTYFSALSSMSVALDDGNVLILNATQSHNGQNNLYKFNTEGELLDVVASQGRGPGEIQFVRFLSQSAFGNILLYDQGNRKVIILDNEGGYKEEFIIEPWNGLNLSEIYEVGEQKYLMIFRSFYYLYNSEQVPELHLVLYDKVQDAYTVSRKFSDRVHARIIVDGVTAGYRPVHYAHDQLRSYDSYTGDMYQYWSGGKEIVQLGMDLDTLRVIQIPAELEHLDLDDEVIQQERLSDLTWPEVEPLLPEYKALADRMLIDHESNFWLLLNYASEYQQWLVLSREGEPLQIVQLPKEVTLTHVSDNHIGVRVDRTTFAFYEPAVDLP